MIHDIVQILCNKQFFVTLYFKLEKTFRVNPDSLSYPFPLVVRVHVRVRASSGFDRGVGVRGRGR